MDQIEGIWFAKDMASLGRPNRRVKIAVERKPIASSERLSLADYSVTAIAQVRLHVSILLINGVNGSSTHSQLMPEHLKRSGLSLLSIRRFINNESICLK